MCGIGGVLSLRSSRPPLSRGALCRMACALRHRGPDESGIYLSPEVALCHTRLSILDLSTGKQPLGNEDGTIWVVYNGEIFNYIELREELEALGHTFRTRSDTEVIVHAYEAWGERSFRKYNGQFAIALWDERARTLVLARDRFGVCPLYFAEHEGALYFASEIKAIFAAAPDFPRALDPVGLKQTFTFWSIVPPQSVFAGISELEPGHVRVYQRGKVRESAFLEPPYAPKSASERGDAEPPFRGSIEDAERAVREALLEATRLRILRADVPVGSYLSGGLDSSLVAALGHRIKGPSFSTFSIRFEDAEYDETEFQRRMVERLGTSHHEVRVTRRDIAMVFPEVIAHTERPILRTAPAPLFLLSELVHKQGIKVVLTGEGADELFAGYDLFREGKIRRFWAKAPSSLYRPLLLERLYPYLGRSPVAQRAMMRRFFGQNLSLWSTPGFAHETRFRTTSALHRLFSPELRLGLEGQDTIERFFSSLPPELASLPPLSQDQYIELKTLLAGYLLSSQGDRMLMAHSVEGRFPFLDAEVVALASSLPASYKLKVLDEKHVLKRVAKGLLPEALIRRKKQPYRAPDAASFFGEHAPDWILDVTSEAALRDAGIFDPILIDRLLSKCRKESHLGQFSNTDNMALVGVLSTQLLHRRFVRGAPVSVEVTPKTVIDKTEGGRIR